LTAVYVLLGKVGGTFADQSTCAIGATPNAVHKSDSDSESEAEPEPDFRSGF
jgi:hypothetical protein